MAPSTNAFLVRVLVLILVSTPVVFSSSEDYQIVRQLLQTSTGGTPGVIGGTSAVPGATPSTTGTPSAGSTFIPPSASGRAPTVGAPAPSPRNLSPAPAASNTSGLAANGTSPSPAPALAPRNASAPAPAPAGLANQTVLSPGPVPGPGPQNAPAPAPTRIANQTVPSPAPVPAPATHNAPVPAPNNLVNQTTPSQAPVPAPAPNSLGNQTSPSPGPAPVQIPGPAPAPTNSLGVLGNRPGPAPAPSVRVPAPVPSQAQGPAPVPSPSIGVGSVSSISPGPAPEPVSAPVPAPAPNNGLLANQNPSQAPRPSPVQAPSLAPGAPVPAPNIPVPAPNAPVLSVGSRQPVPAPGPAPGQGLTFRPAPSPSTVLAAAPTPSVTGALGPNGVLSPSANLVPTLAPGPSALLRELYPALAPAPTGDAATRVTVAANGQTGIVKVVDSRTGLARSALPSDLNSGESLYAPAGSMNVIVQTSTSQNNLPVNAISAEGATVNTVTPVEGSNGRLFEVGLTSNPGASSVAVSTIAGVTLASGLTTLASNRLQINIASPNPQVSIRSGSGYENGQSVTPSFNIDFGGRVTANDPSGLYTLDGVERSDVVYDIQNGRIFITTYIPEAEANTSRIITVTVPAGVTTDLSGTPNSAAQYIYNYTPKNPKFTTVSNVMNGVAGAGMGVAVVTPLALGLLTTGPASATAAAVGTFTLLNLFRGLQFTYLAGQMRIVNMPPNFRQVANSFQWSVLDFRAPWQTARGNTVSQQRQTTGFSNTPQGVTGSPAGRKLLEDEMRKLLAPALAPISANNGTINLPSATGGNSQYVVTSTGLNQTEGQSSGAVAAASDLVGTVTDAALGETKNPYDTLWRAIFWTAIGLIAVTAIVIGLSTLFIFLNWSVPVILQSPRPQLMLLIIAVPSVAQACAGLFASGGAKDIAVGVVICVVFPAAMFLFAAIFVARHIYRDNRRRAAYVLEGDPELQEKEKPTLISRILDIVVGPKGKEGQWMALKQRDSRFVNQYGPLFEMNLGPPMVLNGVTYDVDPKTGYCNRGQLVPLYEKPVFKLGRLVIYPHQLQGQNASYEIAQGIATAILLKSFTQPNSFAQVITLIVINVLMLLWLRLIRPVGDRTALIMSMIGTLSTLGTYICGLILLANKDASPAFRDRVGIAMIVLSLWGVVTMLLGWIAQAIFAYHLFIMLRKWAFPSTDPAHKFARVVDNVMAQDEHILARKFGDRWMRQALGVGLHKRTLLRRERERKLDRFREVVFLGVRNQKGRVVNVSTKPGKTGQAGQKPTGAAAWPGMPALSNLKTHAANGNGYHANGKTSLETPGRDTDRILSGNGLTSSQPTTPMSLEKKEIESDPNRYRAKQGKTGNATQTVNPLGEQSNTSPEREARRSLNPPEPNHVIVEMGEPLEERRGRLSPNRSPAREERAQRARDRWSRRFQNDENKEN